MRESKRCDAHHCDSGLPARPYPEGMLCRRHDPSARAGMPHPDEIAAISRANRAASVAAAAAATAETREAA